MTAAAKYPILFRALEVVAEGIAATLGHDCEVVLHDLSHPTTSVIKVINGQVTNRACGQGIRDLLGILNSPRFKEDVLANYTTRTQDGKALKSTSMLFRDDRGELIAAICLNYDLAELMRTRKVIDNLCATVDGDTEVPTTEKKGVVLGTLEQIILSTIGETGIPVAAMKKEDKLRIVRFLNEKGAFLIKGGLERVAQALGVSRFTIYKYLEELREAEG